VPKAPAAHFGFKKFEPPVGLCPPSGYDPARVSGIGAGGFSDNEPMTAKAIDVGGLLQAVRRAQHRRLGLNQR
jgi:hypothetical protein